MHWKKSLKYGLLGSSRVQMKSGGVKLISKGIEIKSTQLVHHLHLPVTEYFKNPFQKFSILV